MDRQLREEQDMEFQRTMEADRKRLEEEQKKRDEEEMKIRAAEERETQRIKRQTEHRVNTYTVLKCPNFETDQQFSPNKIMQDRRISAKQNLAPEPSDGGIRIQFKLPNGSRSTRKFLEDQSVGDLFCMQKINMGHGRAYVVHAFIYGLGFNFEKSWF